MTTIDKITAERKKTHGDFSDHAKITQTLKDVLRSFEAEWDKLNDCQKEAIEMIAHKIGRIMAGDPNFADHWDDIGGYAKIARERPTIKEPKNVQIDFKVTAVPYAPEVVAKAEKLDKEILNRHPADVLGIDLFNGA